MPAFAIFRVDPRVEPARISQPVDYLTPRIVFGSAYGSSLEIEGATLEELEIICAMINAVALRRAGQQELPQ